VGTFQHVSRATRWPTRSPPMAPALRRSATGGPTSSRSTTPSLTAAPDAGARRPRDVQLRLDELARRMNLEGAKAVKYGGVPRDEALMFVTANAARQLGVEKRVGSLEPGKDGDFVIWSATRSTRPPSASRRGSTERSTSTRGGPAEAGASRRREVRSRRESPPGRGPGRSTGGSARRSVRRGARRLRRSRRGRSLLGSDSP